MFSLINISGSARSEFTCCSSSFARALVIGPILTSLDISFAAAGVGVGMSSSAYINIIDTSNMRVDKWS
jgi:hypothetical protein